MAEDEVRARIEAVPSPRRRRDAERVVALMERVTGEPPRLWGTSIIGFGQYHYEYESGRKGDGPAASFSPRKAATVVYLADGVGAHDVELGQLGPHEVGVGCLYLKDLDAVDLEALERIVGASYRCLTAGTYRDSHRGPAS